MIIGLIVGLVVGACIGVGLIGIVTYSSDTQDMEDAYRKGYDDGYNRRSYED